MTTGDWLDRILEQLREVRAGCPELRFGQLIAIIGELARDETGFSLWEVEDADFAAAVQRFAAELATRVADRGEQIAPTDGDGVTSRLRPCPPSPRGKKGRRAGFQSRDRKCSHL
jgi:hypothetical protein